MNLKIRIENETDYKEVENLTREAFWNVYKPGCDEHLMVHKMRTSKSHIKELAFIACDGNKIIGNIMYTKAKVINADGTEFQVLCMGPLCVSPNYQNKGVGALLMNHSIKVATDLGYNAIIIFGSHKYYSRFGFKNAEIYNIQTSWGDNFNDFMALELYTGSLDGISGRYHTDPAFNVVEEELAEFEKQFPPKEKLVLEG